MEPVVCPSEKGGDDASDAIGCCARACCCHACPGSGQGPAIQQLDDRFAEAFNTGDMAAVAAMYTEDAVVLPPGAEMIRGRDNIQALWQGAAEQMSDLKLTATNVKPLGDSAVREIGTATARTNGDQPQDMT